MFSFTDLHFNKIAERCAHIPKSLHMCVQDMTKWLTCSLLKICDGVEWALKMHGSTTTPLHDLGIFHTESIGVHLHNREPRGMSRIDFEYAAHHQNTVEKSLHVPHWRTHTEIWGSTDQARMAAERAVHHLDTAERFVHGSCCAF